MVQLHGDLSFFLSWSTLDSPPFAGPDYLFPWTEVSFFRINAGADPILVPLTRNTFPLLKPGIMTRSWSLYSLADLGSGGTETPTSPRV